ncbi:methylenetetrahydromethanopterin reductase [Halovivax asiaticus JCM 14624]|uniref:5,10-methylenetetrahydromethanopterin reductase n=1 Tax=Halovivax asiaticus JCM 14624 TaxID=1227490 RepID=M0BG84_9EURY|nr:5,10-methylenetetrahydromethanopterin reductase [Halovivax asiaticus]ELZ09313.1 methylenetetrahydromethanopterin reductase [Halovivax asiaticus JCM 14624]
MTEDSSGSAENGGSSSDGPRLGSVDPADISRGIELTPEHPVDRLASLAERAEDAEFDAAFTSSHYFNRDPWITLSRMADATDEIALGPGVVNPYETHPATLASAVATLDEVSGGRAVCGLGAGDRSTLAALGIDRDRPLRRVLETMHVARDLWTGETVTHDGAVTVEDASLNVDPVDVPVFVGAQGPRMLGMSAAHGDGVLINAAHPRDLAWASDQLDQGREKRAADRDPLRTLAFASTSVAETEAAAREAARPPVAFIAGGAAEPVLDRHDIDHEAAAAVSDALERGALTDAFEHVTPAMIDAFCVAGTVETVTDRYRVILEHVDGIVVGSPLGPDIDAAIERAATALSNAESPN